MTERVLRWLSATSLIMLVISAGLTITFLPSFVVHLPVGAVGGLAVVLWLLVLPPTVVALCEVTGIATLVVSLQRKQWGWCVGALLCLLLHFYASVALSLPQGFRFLYMLVGTPYASSIYVMLYNLLALTPLALLAFAYAWTRRYPSTASVAG